MHDDRVSIIMTIKNETKFLIQVMKKIYDEAVVKPDQLILVDGMSTDDRIGLIDKLRKKYGFEYIVNDEKGIKDSPFGAFIKGLPLAKYDYVSLWSVDDDPYPHYLLRMKKVIKDYDPELVICSADVARENRRYQRVLYPFDCYVSPECMGKNYKTFSRRINLVGSVIKKSIIEDNIKYLTKVNFDSTYFFYTAFHKGLMNIGEPLILYRSYINSHGQLGKLEDILDWKEVSQKRFMQNLEVYRRAKQSGFWDNIRINHKLLNIVPKLPLWIRHKIYENIYKYDSKEEK
jgi:hypothetical protein